MHIKQKNFYIIKKLFDWKKKETFIKGVYLHKTLFSCLKVLFDSIWHS
jgi:hypothetical protein